MVVAARPRTRKRIAVTQGARWPGRLAAMPVPPRSLGLLHPRDGDADRVGHGPAPRPATAARLSRRFGMATPALTRLIAGLVLFIAVAAMGAIYSLTDTM
jgi:hypothetical protein